MILYFNRNRMLNQLKILMTFHVEDNYKSPKFQVLPELQIPKISGIACV